MVQRNVIAKARFRIAMAKSTKANSANVNSLTADFSGIIGRNMENMAVAATATTTPTNTDCDETRRERGHRVLYHWPFLDRGNLYGGKCDERQNWPRNHE